MNQLDTLSTALEAAVQNHTNHIRHLGNKSIAWRSAVQWDGALWASFAQEASPGETVPLANGGQAGSAVVKAFDAVSGLVLLEVADSASGGIAALADSTAGVGAIALTIANPSPDGVEAALGVVRVRPPAGRYFQTDSSNFPGFAGALVVDSQGRFAGLVAREGRGNQGWILPAARVRERLQALQTHGDLHVPRVGVVLEAIELEKSVTADNSRQSGLLVREVAKGSAAELAGLHQGDIVVAVAGQAVESTGAFIEELGALAIGSAVSIDRLRGGVRETLKLQPDYRLGAAKA